MGNNTFNWNVSEGQLVTPNVHDAKLLGIILFESNRVRAFLRLADGTHISLLFSGVERLRMDDFRQGNIVLDLSIQRGPEIPVDEVAYAYGIDQEPHRTTFLEKMLAEVRTKKFISVTLNPSFGAAFTCLCSDVIAEPLAASQQRLLYGGL